MSFPLKDSHHQRKHPAAVSQDVLVQTSPWTSGTSGSRKSFVSLSLSYSTWFHPPKAASSGFENLAKISN